MTGNGSGLTVRAGALFLDFEALPTQSLLTRGNLVPVMNADEIDPDVSGGWELAIDKQLSSKWSIGARYFNVDSIDDLVAKTNLVNGAGVRYRNTVSGVLGAVLGASNVSYGAQLDSFELMAGRQVTDCIRLSTGVRYVRFEDYVDARISGGIFTSRSLLQASNELVGPQLGTDVLFLRLNRFELIGIGLAACITMTPMQDLPCAMWQRNSRGTASQQLLSLAKPS